MDPFKFLQEKKHLNYDTLKAFRIGVLAHRGWGGIINDPNGLTFFSYDFPDELVEDACSIRTEKIIIPVFDVYGDVVGSTTRNFSEFLSKYTHDYKKTKFVFGLNLVWKDIMERDAVYVVEGPMDCMVMWQHGIKNVVCAGGISLSMDQLCLLRRFCKKVNILLDGDNTGFDESLKMRKAVEECGMDCTVVSLPPGYDPDDFVNERPDGVDFIVEHTGIDLRKEVVR